MRNLFLVCVFLCSFACIAGKSTEVQQSRLITALIAVESSGDDLAIGDKSLVNKAYGCLQIRQPCVDDVNRLHHTNYKAEDCLGNRSISIWIFEKYIELWATEKRLGRKPTDQDRARIWNGGGPSGFKKVSTIGYWKKVEKKLSEL